MENGQQLTKIQGQSNKYIQKEMGRWECRKTDSSLSPLLHKKKKNSMRDI